MSEGLKHSRNRKKHVSNFKSGCGPSIYEATSGYTIEGFNSRSSQSGNNKAMKLASKYNKPVVAGSDAHFASEIGLGKTSINTKEGIKREILNGRTELEVSQSPAYLQSLSQMIKSIKMREYRNIPVLAASFIIKLAKGG